eukprot:CAMPEP_0180824460 /NCGR_PEP_ID=MMETSP1038_2-20121128/72450_1 /TAXON_ID=632150 /ORGANISM="Azadinium spinosum, Strain 3D9" /LENGTH=41 /DNA_ID= /DNA_START= /DNA_END= /DNA_ORIENTATION=
MSFAIPLPLNLILHTFFSASFENWLSGLSTVNLTNMVCPAK